MSRATFLQGFIESQDTLLFLLTGVSSRIKAYLHLTKLPQERQAYSPESPFINNPINLDKAIS